ncbi:hypothetical protein CRENBAI_018009 [Crenichthys baileyi]|uniref:Uncharacterized protein n=1 Tax=Crenichthys baileyi TaxID=28760 RepID=A0AAV9SPH7_9TELE
MTHGSDPYPQLLPQPPKTCVPIRRSGYLVQMSQPTRAVPGRNSTSPLMNSDLNPMKPNMNFSTGPPPSRTNISNTCLQTQMPSIAFPQRNSPTDKLYPGKHHLSLCPQSTVLTTDPPDPTSRADKVNRQVVPGQWHAPGSNGLHNVPATTETPHITATAQQPRGETPTSTASPSPPSRSKCQ